MLFNVSCKKALAASLISLTLSLEAHSADLACQQLSEGAEVSRIRYEAPEVQQPNTCLSQVQKLICDANGEASWSGDYQYVSCQDYKDDSLPLLKANNWQYEGAFLLPNPTDGYNTKLSFEMSEGVMAYNPANDSLFIVGHKGGQNVAEVEIPNLVKSNDFEEMAKSQYFYQPFSSINVNSRLSNTISNFRINGLTYVDGRLLVNYMDKKNYGTAKSTTLVLDDAANIAGSNIQEGLLLEGGLHASGSLSAVPTEWQARLNGNYLAGAPGPTIASLTSQGPTAFSFAIEDLQSTNLQVATTKLLGFSHSKSLFDKSLQEDGVKPSKVLQNNNGLNEWWTINSLAAYSFILPGTSTLVTIGKSEGHESGIGYQITQDSGNQCGGYCANKAADKYGYIWLWDLRDLESVYAGRLSPNEVKPYYYSKLETPFGTNIMGATYDSANNRLFVATQGGDTSDNKDKPVVSVFTLEPKENSVAIDCPNVADGDYISRYKYKSPLAVTGEQCLVQEQKSFCQAGVMSAWSGDYTEDNCVKVSMSLPRASIDNFEFEGGFRITSSKYGEGRASTNYSRGIFTYNPDNHSIYVIGSPKEEQIAEFSIPELVKSTNIEDYNQAANPLQDFTLIQGTDRVDTGIDKYFKVTGLEYIEGKLLVNYVKWYDGNGNETDTTLYYEDANNLSTSKMFGPFQLDGKARAAGWLSEVPQEWQDLLGGSHIAGGQSGTSIISRLSVGPSAFMINPTETIFGREGGAIPTSGLMDYPLSNMLYDKEVYGASYGSPQSILYNESGENDLWTTLSGAGYGFIIPGTRTYMTFGKSGGVESGVGYKIRQEDGYLCPGPCSYDSQDNYPFFWLWDVEDLLKVKYGMMEAHDVRPYSHGKFPMPAGLDIRSLNGGAFDPTTSTLYMSSPKADKLKQYAETPVFFAFKYRAM